MWKPTSSMLWLLLLPALATQAAPVLIDESLIDNGVMSGVSGSGALNMASGDANRQINSTAISGNGQGAAHANVQAQQVIDSFTGTMPDSAVSRIGDYAFAGAIGAISVNQVSGAANSQANGVAIAAGINEVSADALADSTSGGLVWAGHSTGAKEVSVADTAFQGAQGIVQLNQTAGVGNSSSNNFALSLNFGPKL